MAIALVGREREKRNLMRIWKSRNPKFAALHGRRRVGKTFLIREFFKGKGIYFEATGEKDAPFHEQLENFTKSIEATFSQDIPLKRTTSWKEAFSLLTKHIRKVPKKNNIIIFLDELPWMAVKRTGLIQGLDYFWNTQWNQCANLKVIVCGSAASWMLENLIYARGGLHNRLTHIINLRPFSLNEVKEFLLSRNIKFKDKQICDLYMAIGGIPHYWKFIEKRKSVIQNINDLCFQKDGLLFNEFTLVFRSLFDRFQVHESIIRVIAKKRNGISREELLNTLGITSGGSFKKRLDELESSGFIEIFILFGRKKKDYFVKVTDEYTLFYLYWIDTLKSKRTIGENKNYWLTKCKDPAWKIWAGYAFESICQKHKNEILYALGLESVGGEIGPWRFLPKKGSNEKGAQIDLLIDRNDNAFTLCEIKYSDSLFLIDKEYSKKLKNKIEVFEERFNPKKEVFLPMITTMGIKRNIWTEDLITSEVTLSDLFRTLIF